MGVGGAVTQKISHLSSPRYTLSTMELSQISLEVNAFFSTPSQGFLGFA